MSHATIIAAIDTAIESWSGKPVELAEGNRRVTYRSLKELMEARAYYANLSAGASGSTGFKISKLVSGDGK